MHELRTSFTQKVVTGTNHQPKFPHQTLASLNETRPLSHGNTHSYRLCSLYPQQAFVCRILYQLQFGQKPFVQVFGLASVHKYNQAMRQHIFVPWAAARVWNNYIAVREVISFKSHHSVTSKTAWTKVRASYNGLPATHFLYVDAQITEYYPECIFGGQRTHRV